MDFLAQTILPYILLYKYWALFFFTFLSALAIPIPAGTLLVASAAFASQHYLNFFFILIVAAAANIIGDTICYWVFRLYGHRILDRFAFTRKILRSKNFRLIEAKIRQRPGFVIFISRFESLANLSVNIVCGLGKVSYRRYIVFEAMGAMADATLYGSIGYIFGDSWEAVNNLIGNFSIIVFVILIVCIILFWKKLMGDKTIDFYH